MENREHYAMKKRVLENRYKSIVSEWKDCSDDRTLAYNLYNMLLSVCDTMMISPYNNTICVFVNDGMKRREKDIDDIIRRFNKGDNMDRRYSDMVKFTDDPYCFLYE